MGWLRSFACLVVAATLCGSARADDAPRDPAAAEALFTQGRKAFDAGQYAEACHKFAESQRLDPAVGTLINLAACREKTGQLALAWTAWAEALRTLRADDERRPEVARRAKALEGRVPYLTVEGSLPSGSRVFRDGVELGPAVLGAAMPIDPGKHTLRVEAPGREPATFEVEIKESESKKMAVEVGPPSKVEPPLIETKPKTEPIVEAKPAADRAEPSSNQRTIGFVVGGVGAASLIASGVTGFLALDRKNTMNDNCTEQAGTQRCNATGLDAADSGKTLSTVSTITFAAGVVMLGVGGYLVLSSGESGKSTVGASAHPHGGGLRFARSF